MASTIWRRSSFAGLESAGKINVVRGLKVLRLVCDTAAFRDSVKMRTPEVIFKSPVDFESHIR